MPTPKMSARIIPIRIAFPKITNEFIVLRHLLIRWLTNFLCTTNGPRPSIATLQSFALISINHGGTAIYPSATAAARRPLEIASCEQDRDPAPTYAHGHAGV
jgi:hypothetical protein